MQNLATGEIADSVREIASFRTKIKDIGSKVMMIKMTMVMVLTMMKPAVVMVMDMMGYDLEKTKSIHGANHDSEIWLESCINIAI